MSKKGTSLWDVIKTFLAFLFTKKEKNKEELKIEAEKIDETLTEGYQKIDKEKEEKQEKEELKDVTDDLNNIF